MGTLDTQLLKNVQIIGRGIIQPGYRYIFLKKIGGKVYLGLTQTPDIKTAGVKHFSEIIILIFLDSGFVYPKKILGYIFFTYISSSVFLYIYLFIYKVSFFVLSYDYIFSLFMMAKGSC